MLQCEEPNAGGVAKTDDDMTAREHINAMKELQEAAHEANMGRVRLALRGRDVGSMQGCP